MPAGARMALIGPNGAGKTAVFNLISGVFPVELGSIVLEGRRSRICRRARGYVPDLRDHSRIFA